MGDSGHVRGGRGGGERVQSQVGARGREKGAGGAAGASSESDSSEDTRSAALSATRAYSSVSMLLQKWIAYLGAEATL